MANNPALRPPTPPITMWFEFLLDESLLIKHLSMPNADPSPGDLIALFLYQADVSAATAREIKEGTQGIDLDHLNDQLTENRKIKALKLLALKVAGHLKWDLAILDKGVPLAMVQDILLELLRLTLTKEDAEPPRHKMLDFEKLSGQALFAIQLYHRWCLKTAIESSFPVKQSKGQNVHVPGLLDPNAATASAKETVLQVVRDGMEDSTIVLSRLTELGRKVSMPNLASIGSYHDDKEAEHDWSKCTDVPEKELLCQVCYDLGVVYFSQQKYQEAYAMFKKATELHSQLGGETVMCVVDAARLQGYYAACSGLLGHQPSKTSLIDRVEAERKNGYENLTKLLWEDNTKRELCVSYRLAIEEELKKQKPDSLQYQQAVIANGIRRILDSRLLPREFIHLLKSKSDLLRDFLELCSETAKTCSYNQKSNVTHLLRYLSHAMPAETEFVSKLSKDKILSGLFNSAELESLCHLQVEAACPLDVDKDLSSKAGDKTIQQHELERQLLTTYDPATMKDLITKLSGKMAKQQLHQLKGLSDKWRIPRDLASQIETLPIPWVRIYAHVLVAKARICQNLRLYDKARELLRVAEGTTKEISYKLARILPWEILRLELLQFNTFGIFCPGQNLSDLKKRAKTCFAAMDGKHGGGQGKHDVRPHEEVIVSCVIFLINIRDWEGLITMFNTRNGYIEFGRLISLLCKELPHVKTARKPSRDLWEAIVLMFTNVPSGQKRNSDGSMKQCEGNQGPITRQQYAEILDKISEPTVLSALISLLSRLYMCLKDEITIDITTDYSGLWPTTISNPGSVSIPAVEEAVHITLSRALFLNPSQPAWLRTKGDLCFASGQHSQALKHYLEMGILATDYFYDQVNKNVYDEQMIKRMIKSCYSLQCYTQALVLCQFLDEPDYTTAFKAAQERICHDSMDTYYDYIWDSTMLEYLVHLHTKRGEHDKRNVAMKAIGELELNASNPPEILFEAARTRKARFLRAMARQYV